MQQPIGVFDSGYGGLTILKDIRVQLPQYDYIYLGDNARTPYGPRSFDTVYQYTLECVNWLFTQGCSLVVLACNTASAKALRTIQQNDLQRIAPGKRVLGVIRPTTEIIGTYSKSGKVGVLATTGTVRSGSYLIEIEKFFPQVEVYQQACPMWVPLVENNEQNAAGADYFVKSSIEQLMQQQPDIDTILLGCTHYPLLLTKIQQCLAPGITVVSQGAIVAKSLKDYLQRHPEMEEHCSKTGKMAFYTTDSAESFDSAAAIFFGKPVKSVHLTL
jgi:glutamate racemase